MLHSLPNRPDYLPNELRGWTPTFRTGGGFSLVSRSPRERSVHDELLPSQPASGMQPKFLADLLEKLPESRSPEALPTLTTTPRNVTPSSPRSAATPSFTLELPPEIGGASLPGGRRRTLNTAPASVVASPTRRPRLAAASPPLTMLRPSSSSRPTEELNAQPARTGLQGRMPRQALHRGGTGSSIHRGVLQAQATVKRPISPQRVEATAPSVLIELPVAPAAQLPPSRREEASLLPIPCMELVHQRAGHVNETDLGGTDVAQAGVVSDSNSARGALAVPCVPFPSMRHAKHLRSVQRTIAGTRGPPAAPANRDESALDRVSTSSIRPCIHDKELAIRFGAKAAFRAPSPRDAMRAGKECAASSETTALGSEGEIMAGLRGEPLVMTARPNRSPR